MAPIPPAKGHYPATLRECPQREITGLRSPRARWREQLAFNDITKNNCFKMSVIARLDWAIQSPPGLPLKHRIEAGGYWMPRLKRGMTRIRFAYSPQSPNKPGRSFPCPEVTGPAAPATAAPACAPGRRPPAAAEEEARSC